MRCQHDKERLMSILLKKKYKDVSVKIYYILLKYKNKI